MSGHNGGVYTPQNLGLYTYSYNSPVNLVDPDGNMPTKIKFTTKKPKDYAPRSLGKVFQHWTRNWSGYLKNNTNVRSVFRNTSSLRSNLGLKVGDKGRAHHDIPVAVAKNNKWVKAAIERGFGFNKKENGTVLTNYSRKNDDGSHGSHPAYNKWVENLINKTFKNDPKPNDLKFDSQNFMNKFRDQLMPKIKGVTNKVQQDKLNLNNYIKTIEGGK